MTTCKKNWDMWWSGTTDLHPNGISGLKWVIPNIEGTSNKCLDDAYCNVDPYHRWGNAVGRNVETDHPIRWPE